MKAEEVIMDAVIEASRKLPIEAVKALEKAREEENGNSKVVLNAILDNLALAEKLEIPLCQDTAMTWCWAEIGRNARLDIVKLEKLINSSLSKAFKKGLFRTSVVSDVMGERKNTGDNLPAVINYSLTSGSDITLHFLLKGFGSENCSSVTMLNPTAGKEGVVEAVVESMRKAGAKPCPPVFIGVGVGGTMDRAALMSKEAFFKRGRESDVEREIKERVNALSIGPGGMGGKNSCLGVFLKEEETHIAGLPVAVTVNCWAERKTEVVLVGGYDGD